MAGYRAGYSEQHSPRWREGWLDGRFDRIGLSLDPPQEPIGPMPPDIEYRAMYDRGYEAGFQGEARK